MTYVAYYYRRGITGNCDICNREANPLYIFLIPNFKPILVCESCMINMCRRLGLRPQKGDEE
jgi:hypothetical protein